MRIIRKRLEPQEIETTCIWCGAIIGVLQTDGELVVMVDPGESNFRRVKCPECNDELRLDIKLWPDWHLQ